MIVESQFDLLIALGYLPEGCPTSCNQWAGWVIGSLERLSMLADEAHVENDQQFFLFKERVVGAFTWPRILPRGA
jgi:hypothetical protein